MSTKKPVRETAAKTRGLAFLIESELEKAEVVLAAKAILEKLQGMAEDLAKVEANDIMPMLDGMRLTFGPELADAFNETTTAKLRQTTEAIKAAKDSIASEVAKLEGSVNGGLTNDMATGSQDQDAPELGGGLGDDAGLGDMGDMGGDADAAMGDEGMGDMGDMGDEGMGDLDAAFDDAAEQNSAAGRARKESVERNVKALRESKNPDRLVYETFKRTLKEARNAVTAAKAVAEAFSIDLNDVIDIVKEGKTFKDEKGNSKKNKDRSENRAEKKRNRPSDLDEGKTFKDEKGNSNKNKDRSEDRKRKNREREDLEEGATFVPFAEREAAESARLAKEAYEASKGKRARIGERTTRRGLAFRMPDGKLRPVYDPYKPAYPEGSTPGWATIGQTLRYYPNDTTGYTMDVTDFQPLEGGLTEDASKKACPDCGAPEVVADADGQYCQKCQWTPAAPLEENLVNRMKPRKSMNDLATRTLDLPDSNSANAKAMQDYKSHVSRTMEVPYVYGMVDGEPRQFNARPQDPFVVRVINTEQELVNHWEGNVLEPRWRVQITDGQGMLPPNVKQGWIDGPSYRVQKRGLGK